MRKIIFIITALAAGKFSLGQQLPIFTQYMNADFVLNPAIAGSQDFAPLRLINRAQWSGLEGRPNTQALSLHSKIGKGNTGVGGYVFNDKLGPISKTGVNASYSYTIQFKEKGKLAFGLSAMFYFFKLNAEELIFDNNENQDNVLLESNFKAYYPNSSFGIYYYGEKFFGSFSIPELIPNKISSTQDKDIFVLKQVQHYYISGGYTFRLSDHYKIQPSAMIDYVNAAPVKTHVTLNFIASDKINAGFSYRRNEAIALFFGVKIKDKFRLGYAYDITTSNLNTYANGTHEIMLGYDIKWKKDAAATEEKPKEIINPEIDEMKEEENK